MKVCEVPKRSKRRTERGSIKSSKQEFIVTGGSWCLKIFRLDEVRDPIFLAIDVRSSTGRLLLKREIRISSSVRSQVCRERTEEVAEDIFFKSLNQSYYAGKSDFLHFTCIRN